VIRLTFLMGLALSAKAITLHPNQPSNVYLIYNASAQPVWLNHESSSGVSAGWASQIWPAHYSVLVLGQSKKLFTLSCQAASFKPLACDGRVRVWSLGVRSLKPLAGGYWLSENTLPTALMIKGLLSGVSLGFRPIF